MQQFIGLYACYFSSIFRFDLPPVFLQPLIYVPRSGIPGRLWHHFFSIALRNPALKIAFCHSKDEMEHYRNQFPFVAEKLRYHRFAVEPIPSATEPAPTPFFFSAGSSCRDYSTLFEAARQLPPELPPIRIACKPSDIAKLSPPPNVEIDHHLWQERYFTTMAQARLVIIPLLPMRASAGQIVFSQAMSAGHPIIATRTSTSCEYLDETCAWLVPPQDPNALATAMMEAWQHPDECLKRGAAAKDRFTRINSPETIFQQYATTVAAELSRIP